MKFEDYRAEMKRRLAEADWRVPKNKGKAHDLLVDASRDSEVSIDEFAVLAGMLYR